MSADALWRRRTGGGRGRSAALRRCARLPVLLATGWLASVPLAAADTPSSAACPHGSLPPSVTEARAALEREQNELAPRLRLADALVDQGCYEDAVAVLEAGRAMHPHSRELSGKLRDVRSMITEQTYIRGITEAADAAKLQHDQLRCRKLGDLDACNEALKSTPNDVSLWVAKADALEQGGHLAEAIDSYQHAALLSPADNALKAKLATAVALKNASPAPAATTVAAASTPAAAAGAGPRRRRAGASAAAVVAASPQRSPAFAADIGETPRVAFAGRGTSPAATYSNDAPPGRSN
jgi:tetratricopeptide (TPR) repeat protein